MKRVCMIVMLIVSASNLNATAQSTQKPKPIGPWTPLEPRQITRIIATSDGFIITDQYQHSRSVNRSDVGKDHIDKFDLYAWHPTLQTEDTVHFNTEAAGLRWLPKAELTELESVVIDAILEYKERQDAAQRERMIYTLEQQYGHTNIQTLADNPDLERWINDNPAFYELINSDDVHDVHIAIVRYKEYRAALENE